MPKISSNQIVVTALFFGVLLLLSLIVPKFFIADDLWLIKSAYSRPVPWFSDWTYSADGLYRPLFILFLKSEYLFWGLNPFYYYLSNLCIHAINAVIIFLCIKKLDNLISLQLNKTIIILVPFLYFIMPQNLSAVLWISCGSDLLCGLFLFSSMYCLLHYIEHCKEKHLFFAISLLILSLLSKETGIAAVFYIIGIYLLVQNKTQFKILPKHIVVFTMVVVLYLTLKYSILINSHAPNIFNGYSINKLFKFLSIGLISFFSTLNYIDIKLITRSKDPAAYLISFFGFVYLLLLCFCYLKYSRTHRKMAGITILLGFCSLFIYINQVPQMRLMYVHLPFVLFSVIVVLSSIKNRLTLLYFTIIISLSVIISAYPVINTNAAAQHYYLKLEEAIQKTTAGKNYIVLSSIGRLGQTWLKPNLNLLPSYVKQKNIDSAYNNFTAPFYIEGNSFSKISNIVKVSKVDANNILVEAKKGFFFVPEPAKKFESKNTEIQTNNGFARISIIDFDNTDLPAKLLIYFEKPISEFGFIY